MARGKPSLLGRSGSGPPLAAPGWRWRVAPRGDKYFYSPDGKCFRSMVQLNAFLSSTPGMPSPWQFRWDVDASEFLDGGEDSAGDEEAGEAPTPQRKRLLQVTGFPKRKRSRLSRPRANVAPLMVVLNTVKAFDEGNEEPTGSDHNDEEEEEEQIDADEVGTSSADRAVSEKAVTRETDHGKEPTPFVSDTIVPDNVTLATVLASPQSHALAHEPYVMGKLLEEESRLPEKSANEMKHLQHVIAAKTRDADDFRRHPKEALRIFFHVLRGEKPPPSFGVQELVKMCSSWACRHRRPWCSLEAAHLLVLQCLAEKRDDVTLQRLSLGRKVAEALLLTCGNCNVEDCCADLAFCPGCTCNICKDEIDTTKSWSYLRCDRCHHLSHLDCVLAGMGSGQQVQQHSCATCLKKSELVPFWKTRIKESIGVTDGEVLEQQLLSALRVMEKASGGRYDPAFLRLLKLVKELTSRRGCTDDVHTVLEQIVVSSHDWQLLNDYDDKVTDRTVLTELLAEESKAGTLSEEEARAQDLQRRAELDFAEWLLSMRTVESLKQLLESAEEESDRRRHAANTSKLGYQRANKRVEVLKMLDDSPAVSSESLELLRWNLEQEMSKMESMFCAARSLKVTDANEYLSKLSLALEEMRAQGQVVEGIQLRSRQLRAMQKIMENQKLLNKIL